MDLEKKFLLYALGMDALNLLFFSGFVAPLQQLGTFFALLTFGLAIAQMLMVARLKDYFQRKKNAEDKNKPPTPEDNISPVTGGRIIIAMEKYTPWSRVLTVIVVATVLYIYLIIFVPFATMPTGVDIYSLPAYRIGTGMNLFILMQAMIIPGLHVGSIFIGSVGLTK